MWSFCFSGGGCDAVPAPPPVIIANFPSTDIVIVDFHEIRGSWFLVYLFEYRTWRKIQFLYGVKWQMKDQGAGVC